MKRRRLFCEISPFTYRISEMKCRTLRHLQNRLVQKQFAAKKTERPLPILLYRHSSLIRRTLGNVDLALQENKAVNLSIAAPKVNGILVRPGEVFSLWHLVGAASKRRGYQEGLTISSGRPSKGTGGGLCQLSNLIHWMVLHTDLTITEHHHHDGVDLFPDYNRQIPFGTGTSILYNYLDYRVRNDTDNTYQLLMRCTDEYLQGEIRAEHPQKWKYHIKAEDERFIRQGGEVYRTGKIFRERVDKATGCVVSKQLIKENRARVLYDTSHLPISD